MTGPALIVLFVLSLAHTSSGVTPWSNRTYVCPNIRDCDINKLCIVYTSGAKFCVNPAVIRCDHMLEMERKANCWQTGYLISHGFAQCSQLFEHKDTFDSAGQRWVDCTTKCLIDIVDSYIRNNGTSTENRTNTDGVVDDCDALKDFAFSTYPKCFDRCGFLRVLQSNFQPFVGLMNRMDSELTQIIMNKTKGAVKEACPKSINKRCGIGRIFLELDEQLHGKSTQQ